MQSGLEEMSIWGLITGASLLVQAVMLILVIASITSWYLIVLRSNQFGRLNKQTADFLTRFNQTADLALFLQDIRSLKGANHPTGLNTVFNAGYQEFVTLKQVPNIAPEAVTEGVERAMLVAISEEEAKLESGLSYLATVGSVSPYIGLFGTVWGIMNAFIGLSQVQQATLSTVAPGIAEALIATAIGLFAAIPAVVAYNRFSARAASMTARYYTFANALQVRLHRVLYDKSASIKPVNTSLAA